MYSERIVSAGGLSAFVEAAAGPLVARLHACVWAVSYFLYLPYTVTYVVYDVLPAIFPGITPYRATLELAIPAAIFALVLAPRVFAFGALTALAGAQLVLAAVLGVVEASHAGAPTHSFATHVSSTTGRGIGDVALLFVCASLPLFFGAEVRGGGRTVRKSLVAAYACTAAVLLLGAIPLSAVPPSLRGAGLPGVAIAQAYAGRPLAVAVGIGSAASVVGLIVLEFLALGRLAQWALRVPLWPALATIGIPFVAADAISLVDPQRFYGDLLRPSLVALWISQLVVFGVFPLFRLRTRPRLLAPATALAAFACALTGYGLYTSLTASLGT